MRTEVDSTVVAVVEQEHEVASIIGARGGSRAGQAAGCRCMGKASRLIVRVNCWRS